MTIKGLKQTFILMSLLKHRMEEWKPEFREFVYVFISNTALHHVQCFHWRRTTCSETNHNKLIIKLNCVSLYTKRIQVQ